LDLVARIGVVTPLGPAQLVGIQAIVIDQGATIMCRIDWPSTREKLTVARDRLGRPVEVECSPP